MGSGVQVEQERDWVVLQPYLGLNLKYMSKNL